MTFCTSCTSCIHRKENVTPFHFRTFCTRLTSPEPAPHDFIEVYGVPGESDFETVFRLLVNGDVIFRVGAISLSQ